MIPRVVTFTVRGIAQPKGSTRAFVPKAWSNYAAATGTTARAIVTSDNPKAAHWQDLIAAQAQFIAGGIMFDDAVALLVTFYLPRPVSLPKRIVSHVRRPDLDKLVRCTKDALIGVLYRDDSQVVELHTYKHYAAGIEPPGAVITVREAEVRHFIQPAPLFER